MEEGKVLKQEEHKCFDCGVSGSKLWKGMVLQCTECARLNVQFDERVFNQDGFCTDGYPNADGVRKDGTQVKLEINGCVPFVTSTLQAWKALPTYHPSQHMESEDED